MILMQTFLGTHTHTHTYMYIVHVHVYVYTKQVNMESWADDDTECEYVILRVMNGVNLWYMYV